MVYKAIQLFVCSRIENWYLFYCTQFSCGKCKTGASESSFSLSLYLSRSDVAFPFTPLAVRTLCRFVSITSIFYSHKIHNMKENCGKCYVRWESSCSELVFNAHPHACIRLTALIHSSIFQLILSALFRIVRVAFAENGARLRDARLWMILWSCSKQQLCVYCVACWCWWSVFIAMI